MRYGATCAVAYLSIQLVHALSPAASLANSTQVRQLSTTPNVLKRFDVIYQM